MGGRKLDGEAKHNAKQAVSSAPERVHGICINRFDYPPPHLSNFTHSGSQHLFFFNVFIILSSSMLLSLCLHFFLSAPFTLLPDLHHTLHLFFLQLQFCLPFLLPLCIWVGDWTSSCGTCKRMASLLLFNWCHLMETSLLSDAVRWRQNSREPENQEQATI